MNIGLFWDLLQQDQIDRQVEKSEDLEGRVTYLEEELAIKIQGKIP